MKNKLLMVLSAAAFLILAMAAPAIEAPADLQPSFNTKTVAVCEYNVDSVYCHDELVVRCGEESYISPKTAEIATCGGMTFQVPEITAFAVFDKDWKDPRNS